MFKKVEYVGFDGRHELKACAEQLTQLVGKDVGTWQSRVEVVWSPAGDDLVDGLALELSMVLDNGVGESSQCVVARKDLIDGDWAAIRCGQAWSDLLGLVSRQQMRRIEEMGSEPLEV